MILLVRPRPHPLSVGLQSFMICEPLELEYLSAALEQEGHECVIVDMILEHRSFIDILHQYRPSAVAFSAYITHVGVVKEYAQQVKDWNSQVMIFVGGIHAEVVPTDFENPNIDCIVHAHGLRSLVEALHVPGMTADYLRQNIAGIWNGQQKEYPRNPVLPGVFPDRSKTKIYRQHYDYIFHSRCALLKTSLGCAFACDFCFCTEIARHRLVERDLAEVIAEIQTIEESNIFIVDDNFLFRRERVLEFCERLDQAGIHKKFLVFGRADFVAANEDVIERFRHSGLQAVFMGLESFRDEELHDMKKRIDVQTNVDAVRILNRLQIECHCGIIVSPHWKTQDFDHLARWLISLGRPFVNIQPLTPMPGTPAFTRLQNTIDTPRQQYELWDMTHLVIAPTQMSRRRFNWNIMKTYFRTTASLSNHLHIWKRYGTRVYFRTSKGSLHLTWQYFKMLWREK